MIVDDGALVSKELPPDIKKGSVETGVEEPLYADSLKRILKRTDERRGCIVGWLTFWNPKNLQKKWICMGIIFMENPCSDDFSGTRRGDWHRCRVPA